MDYPLDNSPHQERDCDDFDERLYTAEGEACSRTMHMADASNFAACHEALSAGDFSWLDEDARECTLHEEGSIPVTLNFSLQSPPSQESASDSNFLGEDLAHSLDVKRDCSSDCFSGSPLQPFIIAIHGDNDGGSNGGKQKCLSDEELAALTVAELESQLGRLPKMQITAMKKRRRMLLNRQYARNSRSRKACNDRFVLSEVDQLRQDRDRWKLKAETLMLELKAYRSSC